MYATVEARWFLAGPIPEAVSAWFRALPGQSEPEPTRVDHYLSGSGDGVGIKLRHGRLEIKQRYRQRGIVHFHDRAGASVSHWRKWSFPLAPRAVDVAPGSYWIAVEKTRRIHRYGVVEEGRIIPAAERDWGWCEVELSTVRVAGRVWWSLCFETAQADAALESILQPVARYVFAEGIPCDLLPADSSAYPRWLEKRVEKEEG